MKRRTIIFNSKEQYSLYIFELEGQITDGIYENARPFHHDWWLESAQVMLDETAEKPSANFATDIDYNLNEFVDHVKRLERMRKQGKVDINFNCLIEQSELKKSERESLDYRFVIRCLNYIRFAKANTKEDIDNITIYSRCTLDEFPVKKMPFEDFKKWIIKEKDWRADEKYWEGITEETYNNYYSVPEIDAAEFEKVNTEMSSVFLGKK